MRYISEVRDKLAQRLALIPWQSEPPVGAEGLRQNLQGDSNQMNQRFDA